MSKHCAEHRHPLSHTGTSQSERTLTALSPSFAKIDGRSMEELLAFAHRYAKLIIYYNTSASKDGDWQRFFEMDEGSLLAVIGQFSDRLLDTLSDWSALKALVRQWKNQLPFDSVFRKELEMALDQDFPAAAAVADQEQQDLLYRMAFQKLTAKARYLLPKVLQKANRQPHMALFLSFLELYKHLQYQLNQLPKQQHDFFLEKVLRLQRKAETPDAVHVFFKLAKNQEEKLLPAGTQLLAGKDSLGKKLKYVLKEDQVFNRAVVDRIQTLFIDRSDQGKLYAAPAANSMDGQGGDFENPDLAHWAPFGDGSGPDATVGLAIASPLLYLQEGTRKIILKITFKSAPVGINSLQLSNSFRFLLSGAEAWVEPDAYSAELSNSSLDLSFVIDLGEAAPAIVGFDQEALSGNYPTRHPIIQVLLERPAAAGNDYAYGVFAESSIETIEIDVHCTGLSTLILQNDFSQFEAGKAFQPFGPRPKLGANFYIGSEEAFQKKLSYLGITIEWEGLPADLVDHYSRYLLGEITDNDNNSGTPIIQDNKDFKVNAFALEGHRWQSINSQVDLFQEVIAKSSALEPVVFADPLSQLFFQQLQLSPLEMDLDPLGSFKAFNKFQPHQVYAGPSHLSPVSILAFEEADLAFRPAASITALESYGPQTATGFVRLQLNSQDFLHDEYGKMYTQAVTKEVDLPNEPYTPKIRQIAIDYKATAQYSFPINSHNRNTDTPTQVFHIYPFGYKEVSDQSSGTIFPPFKLDETEIEGALYLGIRDLQPNQTLSMLFQVLEGSGDPGIAVPNISWSYLGEKAWQEFETSAILSDTTLGLTQSGIIKFSIPSNVSTSNTQHQTGLCWIKAAVLVSSDEVQSSKAFPRLIDVKAQAALAVFQNQDNSPDHLETALPPESISKLAIRVPEVAEIHQPYASFGGKLPENDAHFYRRTSEHLRHKGRAINIRDYERLILEAFSSIHKVKCVSHHNTNNAKSPGHVLIGLIPDLANRESIQPFEPKVAVGLLEQIEAFLSKRVTPFIRCQLHIANPSYEQVKVHFEVLFQKGYEDSGYYEQVLNDAIKQYLAPWAYASTAKIAFGGTLNVSEIIHFIEQLPYVDYIKNFRADHLVPNEETKYNVWEIEATGPISVLTSADKHDISVIKRGTEEIFDCPEKTC